jgi:hypothetical protein
MEAYLEDIYISLIIVIMLMGHLILFEHVNFHGKHKHIFQDEPNLDAADDNSFNDITSSIVILEGKWEFFVHKDFQHHTGLFLEPGLYPTVFDVEIENDAVSSLRQV